VTAYGQVRYAGFWRRFGATLIDAILFSILASLLLFLMYGEAYFDWAATSGDVFVSYGWGEFAVNNLLPMVISVACWVTLAGTPGKLLMGCHVVDARSFRKVTIGQGVIRYLCYFLSALPLCLGFFWIAWDKRKQGFHDKIAKTVVIHEDESMRTIEELEKGFDA
jgi:uncharacterized RDD family membrane protein YckC